MGKVTVSRSNEKEEFTGCTSCCFGFLSFVCQILLFGALGLVLYWVIEYRGGFAWRETPEKEFNYHPVLMVGGFIFLMGEAMLVYRTCRCCRRIYNKLWHTLLHLLAMPAIAIGIVAVFDAREHAPTRVEHLYSFHSWMGIGTVGLFCLQFLVGFFSFLVLLCCDASTASFRAALHPIHVHFGIATFVMACATTLTGLTEKVLYTYYYDYSQRPIESWVVNALAMTVVAIGLVMTFIVRYPRFQRASSTILSERL